MSEPPFTTLIVDARVYAPGYPGATSVALGPDGITWMGSSAELPAVDPSTTRVVHAEGRLLTPGFVDAHVHATNTGLSLISLDVTDVCSALELLERIDGYGVRHPGSMIIGHGWDETRWAHSDLPSLDAIDRAARGVPVYLSRIDVHSALVSRALTKALPALEGVPGFSPNSPVVSRQAHGVARTHALASIDTEMRTRAQRAFRAHAAARGVVAVHEMAGPAISGEEDTRALVSLASAEPGPDVFVYWGELASRGGIERARSLGAIGVGGDLFLDGALGSRTAALHAGYADDPSNTGALYVTFEETVDHVVQCTRAGMQAGFHVIGDRACDTVTDALLTASRELPDGTMQALRHRLEHAEMLSDAALDALPGLGVIASMQPLFDELWAGPGGMYEQRLGQARAHAMNRWGSALRRGATVAISSDCPVTELSPWAQIRAAMSHHDPSERLTRDDAVTAHSRAGWEAVGEGRSGDIRPGFRGDVALWDADLDGALPVLDPSATLPTCVATWVRGVWVHGTDLAA